MCGQSAVCLYLMGDHGEISVSKSLQPFVLMPSRAVARTVVCWFEPPTQSQQPIDDFKL